MWNVKKAWSILCCKQRHQWEGWNDSLSKSRQRFQDILLQYGVITRHLRHIHTKDDGVAHRFYWNRFSLF